MSISDFFSNFFPCGLPSNTDETQAKLGKAQDDIKFLEKRIGDLQENFDCLYTNYSLAIETIRHVKSTNEQVQKDFDELQYMYDRAQDRFNYLKARKEKAQEDLDYLQHGQPRCTICNLQDGIDKLTNSNQLGNQTDETQTDEAQPDE